MTDLDRLVILCAGIAMGFAIALLAADPQTPVLQGESVQPGKE